jgi:hypothetical protein
MLCDARRGTSRSRDFLRVGHAGFRGSSCQAIDGAEVPHDPPVVHRRAVPWPGDRISVDLQRRVRRADLDEEVRATAWLTLLVGPRVRRAVSKRSSLGDQKPIDARNSSS